MSQQEPGANPSPSLQLIQGLSPRIETTRKSMVHCLVQKKLEFIWEVMCISLFCSEDLRHAVVAHRRTSRPNNCKESCTKGHSWPKELKPLRVQKRWEMNCKISRERVQSESRGPHLTPISTVPISISAHASRKNVAALGTTTSSLVGNEVELFCHKGLRTTENNHG